MDYLKNFTQFIKVVGLKLAIGIGFIIAGFYWESQTQDNPDFSFHSKFFPAIILLIIGTFIIIHSFITWKRVLMIAWQGYSEQKVRQRHTKVLEYTRGIEKVADLKYDESFFDVLISDVEFIDKHASKVQLLPLIDEKDFDDLWDDLFKPIKLLTDPITRNVGIPIRFGFNEIIINAKVYNKKTIQNINNYHKLNFENLIKISKEKKSKIGLWNWSVTTIPILLLIENVNMDDIWNPKKEKENIKIIRDNILNKIQDDEKNLFHLLNRPCEITEQISAGNVWIVLGGGSWAVEPKEIGGKILSIVPDEGLICWCECASIINRSDNTKLAKNLVKHLLKKETQKTLSETKSYIAFPALDSAFKEFYEKNRTLYNFDDIFDNLEFKKELPIKLREVPKNWHLYETIWKEITKRITG